MIIFPKKEATAGDGDGPAHILSLEDYTLSTTNGPLSQAKFQTFQFRTRCGSASGRRWREKREKTWLTSLVVFSIMSMLRLGDCAIVAGLASKVIATGRRGDDKFNLNPLRLPFLQHTKAYFW